MKHNMPVNEKCHQFRKNALSMEADILREEARSFCIKKMNKGDNKCKAGTLYQQYYL